MGHSRQQVPGSLWNAGNLRGPLAIPGLPFGSRAFSFPRNHFHGPQWALDARMSPVATLRARAICPMAACPRPILTSRVFSEQARLGGVGLRRVALGAGALQESASPREPSRSLWPIMRPRQTHDENDSLSGHCFCYDQTIAPPAPGEHGGRVSAGPYRRTRLLSRSRGDSLLLS